jgi:hypothetical protein
VLRARRERPCSSRTAEQRDELASFYLIELHSVPCQQARAGLQDIELARISQRVSCACSTPQEQISHVCLCLQATALVAYALVVVALDVLDAKLVGSARQEFVELRLGGPDNLVLQHLYQPLDRGIADYGLEHPVALVLQVYEH